MSTPPEEETATPPLTKRSGRPGRAARRRRRKLRSIQQAEERLRSTDDALPQPQQQQQQQVLPTDRSQVWPAVLERRTFHQWSKQDETMLVGQLGYLPGNGIAIAARAGTAPGWFNNNNNPQAPVVVQLYPIVLREEFAGGKAGGRKFKSRKRGRNGGGATKEPEDADTPSTNDDDKSLIEPFPTLYWLTHPELRIRISRLEVESFGIRLQKRLEQDKQALLSMQRAHTLYGQERQQLLTLSDRALVQERHWESAFGAERGVAGIRNHAAIKCLHAHVAHFLSGGPGSADNVVGQWVLQEVEKQCRASSSLKQETSE